MPNDTAPTSDLPFRLRESTFRLYEPFFIEALKRWPEPVIINPAPLRPSTFAARMRDAKASFKVYHWPSALDYDLFMGIYSALTVVHGDNNVVIGPRTRNRRGWGGEAMTQPLALAKTGMLLAERWTEADLRAVCQLLTSRFLSGPVRVQPTLEQGIADLLEANFDVAIENKETETIII